MHCAQFEAVVQRLPPYFSVAYMQSKCFPLGDFLSSSKLSESNCNSLFSVVIMDLAKLGSKSAV